MSLATHVRFGALVSGMSLLLVSPIPTSAGEQTLQEMSTGDSAFVYHVSAAEVAAAVAAAKAAVDGGRQYANMEPFLHLLLRAGPNMVSLENRPSPAPEYSLHKTQYELFYVLEGSGKLYTGGKLLKSSSDNPQGSTSSAATGGKELPISKGDVIMIPPNTVHRVTQSDGKLVLFTVHMPAVDGSTDSRPPASP